MPRKKKEEEVTTTLKKKRKYRKRKPKVVEPVVEEVVVVPEPEPEPDWPELDSDQYVAISYESKNGSLQVGSTLITHNNPLITNDPHSLPATFKMLKSIKSVKVDIIRNPAKFKEKLAKKEVKQIKKEKVVSQDGVMWTGDTLYKTTGYGQFKKNVPQFGLPQEAVDELTNGRGRFVRIKRR